MSPWAPVQSPISDFQVSAPVSLCWRVFSGRWGPVHQTHGRPDVLRQQPRTEAHPWPTGVGNEDPAPLPCGMGDHEACALPRVSEFLSGIQFQSSTVVPGVIKRPILASFPFCFSSPEISRNHLRLNPWLLSLGLDHWVLSIESTGEEGKELRKR